MQAKQRRDVEAQQAAKGQPKDGAGADGGGGGDASEGSDADEAAYERRPRAAEKVQGRPFRWSGGPASCAAAWNAPIPSPASFASAAARAPVCPFERPCICVPRPASSQEEPDERRGLPIKTLAGKVTFEPAKGLRQQPKATEVGP